MTPEQQLKKAFAYEWLKQPSEAYAAALVITQRDTFAAMQIVNKWCYDSDVLQFKEQLIDEHGEEHFLPTKFEAVRDLIDRARNNPFADFERSYKLVAELMGWIEKPGITINNSTTNNKVMVVPVGRLNDNGTVNEDVWESNAISQQQLTIEGQIAVPQ